MNRLIGILGILFFTFFSLVQAQDSAKTEVPEAKFAGYHIGVVQILFGVHKSELSLLDKSDFYSIGFPMGFTFNTRSRLKIDFEIVPIVKPYLEEDTPYSVHLLYHPGILLPLKGKLTLGFRLAFEAGQNQFGFTPLINKSFSLGRQCNFFIELVAPTRFAKNHAFNQLFGIHIGLGL